MSRSKYQIILTAVLCVVATASFSLAENKGDSAESETAKTTEQADADVFTLVVMDPLAAPLSCPCVEGYAQRRYEALADHLESQLGESVKVVFNEALGKAVSGEAAGRADLVIGKDSVVRSDAKKAERSIVPIASLTDKKGSIQQHGLIVVPAKDPAKTVADLAGYDIYFGPAECDEKQGAAIELLKKHQVPIPQKLLTSAACSAGAAKVVELGPKGKSAAVISSYAEPLLEGCGTIQKGDLRVIAKTQPVPFITAFVSADVAADKRVAVQLALLSMADKPELCKALETLVGFLPITEEPVAAKKK